jgi:hypothetical protein
MMHTARLRRRVVTPITGVMTAAISAVAATSLVVGFGVLMSGLWGMS